MHILRNLVAGFALLLAGVAVAGSQTPAAPVAPVRPVVDDYFGTRITDDYRYFEQADNAEVRAWMKAQTAFTRARLDALPGRAALRDELGAIIRSQPARAYGLQIMNGHYYTLRTPPDGSIPKLHVRKGARGTDQLLLDPERLSGKDGAHVSINGYAPSPDNRYVLYGLSEGGSEMPTLHILDRRTGKNLPETIDRSFASVFSWRPDSRGFFYTRLQEMRPGMPATARFQNQQVWLHQLGQPASADRAIVGHGISDAHFALAPDEIPYVTMAPGSKHAIAWISLGVDPRLRAYATRLDAIDRGGDIAWRTLAASYDDQLIVGNVDAELVPARLQGDTVYAISRKRAPNGEVIALDLAGEGAPRSRTLVPAGDLPISAIDANHDALWIVRMDGGNKRVERLPFAKGANAQPLTLPFPGSVDRVFTDPVGRAVIIEASSWLRVPAWLAWEADRRALGTTTLRPAGSMDVDRDMAVTEIKVPSHDGAQVPLTLVHRKGIALDASHRVMMLGYGAYGLSITPDYDPTNRAWFQRGVILAIAHVRGGGELGDAWHRAGFQATKPNTWKDFIACAEFLVKAGYTRPARMSIVGASAGGILIGRALEERPDLFAAAVPMVPVSDLLRFETTANGIGNVAELGSVATEPGFRALLAMSPYANVRNGVDYPAVLITAGINDMRVDAWQPAKLAARLQAATASERPVLLRVDEDAGHGIDSTRQQRIENAADMLAFILWQTGDPAFQPTPVVDERL